MGGMLAGGNVAGIAAPSQSLEVAKNTPSTTR
jgi:hypothetical protein